MTKELEKQLRDLQREVAEVEREKNTIRLHPCQGDSEIIAKDAKYDELDRRGAVLRETIRDLTRKRQFMISGLTQREGFNSP